MSDQSKLLAERIAKLVAKHKKCDHEDKFMALVAVISALGAP